VREAQAKLSRLVESKSPAIITSHGIPKSFLISYDDMLEILEVLEELKDKRLIEEIARARKEYEEGLFVPVERVFKKLGF
jgi:PHD/YefM family antitoxin component YafN of YafNO toxin-antitoxin module